MGRPVRPDLPLARRGRGHVQPAAAQRLPEQGSHSTLPPLAQTWLPVEGTTTCSYFWKAGDNNLVLYASTYKPGDAASESCLAKTCNATAAEEGSGEVGSIMDLCKKAYTWSLLTSPTHKLHCGLCGYLKGRLPRV